MQCDECSKWTCLTCANISKELYLVLIKNNISSLSYLCSSCKQDKTSLNKLAEKIQELQTDSGNHLTLLEKKLHMSNNKFSQIETKLDALKLELEERIDTKIAEKSAQMQQQLQKEIDDRLTTKQIEHIEQISDDMARTKNELSEFIDATIDERISNYITTEKPNNSSPLLLSPTTKSKFTKELEEKIQSEMYDRERRKPNVVIYGLEEGKDDEQDRDIFMKFCNEGLKTEITRESIQKSSRLGPKRTIGNPRPLLVTTTSNDIKTRIFKNAKFLKDSNYNNIQIKNDLTKNEREREKILREEAKKMTNQASGAGTFMVRGPPWARKIVQM